MTHQGRQTLVWPAAGTVPISAASTATASRIGNWIIMAWLGGTPVGLILNCSDAEAFRACGKLAWAGPISDGRNAMAGLNFIERASNEVTDRR
jgi:hypothetical protein